MGRWALEAPRRVTKKARLRAIATDDSYSPPTRYGSRHKYLRAWWFPLSLLALIPPPRPRHLIPPVLGGEAPPVRPVGCGTGSAPAERNTTSEAGPPPGNPPPMARAVATASRWAGQTSASICGCCCCRHWPERSTAEPQAHSAPRSFSSGNSLAACRISRTTTTMLLAVTRTTLSVKQGRATVRTPKVVALASDGSWASKAVRPISTP